MIPSLSRISGPFVATALLVCTACGSSGGSYGLSAKNAATAQVASVDRFQDSVATLWKRSGPAFNPSVYTSKIPAANAAFALDTFLIHGLGPDGTKYTYYSLDIMNPVPQTVYMVVDSSQTPIANQLPIFTQLPGDPNYSDFARITTVQVESSYTANSIASLDDVNTAVSKGATMTLTQMVNNWPMVPQGTTAALNYQGKSPVGNTGWVKGQVVYYAAFETNLQVTSSGQMPAIGLYIMFENNKDPSNGFATESDGISTHNVMAEVPGQPGYSSFWQHYFLQLSAFDSVSNLQTAVAQSPTKIPVIVNCPVVGP